jgi:Co/Zn/Cd efflux system component
VIAASIALIGFGADSLIESISGAVLLWRLQGGGVGESRERLALRLVGISFFLLALYIFVDAVKSLIWREQPEGSTIGVVIAILSLIVMPLLARAKRKVGQRMKSKALVADSKQTTICAYLSVILLVGLILNRLFGWWWSDPVAAYSWSRLSCAKASKRCEGKLAAIKSDFKLGHCPRVRSLALSGYLRSPEFPRATPRPEQYRDSTR